MPGISPSRAFFRRQMRQMLNLRYTARERPHKEQRRTMRDLNFGGRLALMMRHFFAMARC